MTATVRMEVCSVLFRILVYQCLFGNYVLGILARPQYGPSKFQTGAKVRPGNLPLVILPVPSAPRGQYRPGNRPLGGNRYALPPPHPSQSGYGNALSSRPALPLQNPYRQPSGYAKTPKPHTVQYTVHQAPENPPAASGSYAQAPQAYPPAPAYPSVPSYPSAPAYPAAPAYPSAPASPPDPAYPPAPPYPPGPVYAAPAPAYPAPTRVYPPAPTNRPEPSYRPAPAAVASSGQYNDIYKHPPSNSGQKQVQPSLNIVKFEGWNPLEKPPPEDYNNVKPIQTVDNNIALDFPSIFREDVENRKLEVRSGV